MNFFACAEVFQKNFWEHGRGHLCPEQSEKGMPRGRTCARSASGGYVQKRGTFACGKKHCKKFRDTGGKRCGAPLCLLFSLLGPARRHTPLALLPAACARQGYAQASGAQGMSPCTCAAKLSIFPSFGITSIF